MRYYLDCEFDGFGGPLMTMGIACQDGRGLYLIYNTQTNDPWVQKNVVPIIYDLPDDPKIDIVGNAQAWGAQHIANFMGQDYDINILTDWPDDIKYFCQSIIVGPGQMIKIPSFSMHVVRVDAYPTELKGAIQHNAMWDALALKHYIDS